MGSVAAKVLDRAHCPVWTLAPAQKAQTPDLAIGHVLCAVDFSARDGVTSRSAAALADTFGARLTLAHVTPSVENYGPVEITCSMTSKRRWSVPPPGN
jgi:nucleotide-binding universal stress UspA family protein